jgi:RHS repeat-associated protein
VKGGATYYFTYDQVGTLRAVTNATGTVVKRVDYDTFGNILTDTDTSFIVPFGFAGGLQDRDTGLVRFGYRDYDPATGRWTAKDPIGFNGGAVDLYGYCLADPVNFIDPKGLQAVVADICVLGALGALGYPWLRDWFKKFFGPFWDKVNDNSSSDDEVAENVPEGVKDIDAQKPPFKGEPGSTVRGGKQTRRYGQDGFPQTDVDIGHDHGSGKTHAHDWGRPKHGGPPTAQDRGKERPLGPGDPVPPRNAPTI